MQPGATRSRPCTTCRSIRASLPNHRQSAVIARQIALVEAVTLDDLAEPAPCFGPEAHRPRNFARSAEEIAAAVADKKLSARRWPKRRSPDRGARSHSTPSPMSRATRARAKAELSMREHRRDRSPACPMRSRTFTTSPVSSPGRAPRSIATIRRLRPMPCRREARGRRRGPAWRARYGRICLWFHRRKCA